MILQESLMFTEFIESFTSWHVWLPQQNRWSVQWVILIFQRIVYWRWYLDIPLLSPFLLSLCYLAAIFLTALCNKDNFECRELSFHLKDITVRKMSTSHVNVECMKRCNGYEFDGKCWLNIIERGGMLSVDIPAFSSWSSAPTPAAISFPTALGGDRCSKECSSTTRYSSR